MSSERSHFLTHTDRTRTIISYPPKLAVLHPGSVDKSTVDVADWSSGAMSIEVRRRLEGATLSKWHSKVLISSIWYPFGGESWRILLTLYEHFSGL